MDVVFRMSSGEFDENFFKQVKNFLGLKDNLEITISIKEASNGILRDETKEEYFSRLQKAKENLDTNNNVFSIKADDLNEYQTFLLNEP